MAAIVVVVGSVGAAFAFGLIPGMGAAEKPDGDSTALADIEQEPTQLWRVAGDPSSDDVAVWAAGEHRVYRLHTWDAGQDLLEYIDTESGVVLWERSITDPGVALFRLAVDGEHRLVAASYDEMTDIVALLSVDPQTGRDLGSRSWLEPVQDLDLFTTRDSVLMQVDGQLGPVDPRDLTASPPWQVPTEGAYANEALGGGDFLTLEDDGDIVSVVNSATGEVPPWFGGTNLEYTVLGETIIRREVLEDRDQDRNRDRDRVQVVRSDGVPLWNAEVDRLEAHLGADGSAVLYELRRAPQSGAEERQSYEHVMRLSPEDGSPMWDRPVQIPFNAVEEGTEGNALLADWETDQTTILDASTGSTVGTLASTGFKRGDTMYYQVRDGGVLRAWKWNGEPAWTRVVGESGHNIADVPGLLITYNADTGEMARWG